MNSDHGQQAVPTLNAPTKIGEADSVAVGSEEIIDG